MDNTARNFALQLGSLISLYLSLSFLLVLLFGIINIILPDAADTIWSRQSAESSVRFGVAMVVVFFPTYIVLTRTINRIRRTESTGTYLTLTKWLIYLSLLVGGGVLLGDLVAVIMSWLEGELTTRFLLKALTVLIVIGAACYYYLKDAQGYWLSRETASITYGVVVSIIVFASIAYGLTMAGSPAEARERRLDQEQLSDLQSIQWQLEDHLNVEGELPATLEELYVNDVPQAPEDRAAYEYTITDDGFELCATFAFASTEDEVSMARPVLAEKGAFISGSSWEHPAGRYCFERVVNQVE